MKILLIPNAPRMTARHYCLAKSLVASGHEVEYVMWELPYTLPPKEMFKHLFLAFTTKTYQHDSFTVHKFRRLPFFWPFLNGWLFKRQLRALFYRSGADIIFNETYTNETEAPRDLPYIYDLADDYAGPADVFGSKVYKLAFKLLDVRGVMRRQCQNALAVTVVSRLLETYARQYNDTVVRLPNGIDASVVRDVLIATKTAAPNHSLVYASGFGRWSRVVPTMEAVTKLRSEFPDIRLTLIGDGTEVENIKAYIRDNDAESYIDYKGFVASQHELFSLINQSSIGLNVSDKNSWRDASFPMKLIDYSSLGKPVLSTDLAEARNLGFENVTLFSNDGDGLVHAARKMLQAKPKTYSELSKRVLNTYDWAELTSQLVKLCEIALSKKQTRTIVHVTPSYPPRLGGLEKVVQVLATTQQKLGHSVRVITSDHGAKDFAEPEDFPVTRLKSFEIANTTIVPKLFSELKRLQPTDIVHLHVTQAFTPEMVWLAAKSRHFPYIAHIHLDVPPLGVMGFLLEAYKQLLLKRVLHRAAAVIVPTDDYRQLVSEKYRLRKQSIYIVPNGTDHSIVKSPKKLPSKDLKLLFVGRLSPQKNPSLALQSISYFANNFKLPVRLRIVGDGELRKPLGDEALQLNIGKIVNFMGPLSGKEIEDAYASADIFLLSSSSESFGIVLVEAMAKGLPIISTDIPGAKNVVINKKNGLLTRQEPEAIAKSIQKLATDKLLYEQISANNIEEAKKYSWDQVNEQFLAIYKGVL